MKVIPRDKLDGLKPEAMPIKEWKKVKNYIRKLAMRPLTHEQIMEKVEKKFNVSKYEKAELN